MFNRMLSMVMGLAMLVGSAGAVQAQQPYNPGKDRVPLVKTLPVAGYTWRDITFKDYPSARAEREKWRERGHAANILEHKNGFTVRVFDK